MGFGDDFLSVSFTAIANSCVFIEDFCKEVNELEEECFYTACVTIAVAGLFYRCFGFIRFNDGYSFVAGVALAVAVEVNVAGSGNGFGNDVIAVRTNLYFSTFCLAVGSNDYCPL